MRRLNVICEYTTIVIVVKILILTEIIESLLTIIHMGTLKQRRRPYRVKLMIKIAKVKIVIAKILKKTESDIISIVIRLIHLD